MYKLIILIIVLIIVYIYFIRKPEKIISIKKNICIENIPVRLFNVFDEENFHQINEDFETDMFENFECSWCDVIPDTVLCYTLLYFPNNDIKWYDDFYLYDENKDICYMPLPNSLIYSNNSLKLIGDKKIKIIIGKLI